MWCYLRPWFWPHSWNNGIGEGWTNGFLKDIIHFKFFVRSAFGRTLTHPCKIPIAIIPVFQHSNWDESPYLSLSVKINTIAGDRKRNPHYKFPIHQIHLARRHADPVHNTVIDIEQTGGFDRRT